MSAVLTSHWLRIIHGVDRLATPSPRPLPCQPSAARGRCTSGRPLRRRDRHDCCESPRDRSDTDDDAVLLIGHDCGNGHDDGEQSSQPEDSVTQFAHVAVLDGDLDVVDSHDLRECGSIRDRGCILGRDEAFGGVRCRQ